MFDYSEDSLNFQYSEEDTRNCRFCGRFFSHKRSCIRHEKCCFLNNSRQKSDFLCDKCTSSFARKDNLLSHQKTCIKNPKISKTKTPCLVEGCDDKFYHKSALIDHLKCNHKDVMVKDYITKTFSSLEEFKNWKEAEEEATFSFFTKKGGAPKHRKYKYYYCQHDGSAKNHSERKTSRCASKGRIKVGHTCIARMKVWEQENQEVMVEYFPTHSHRCSPQDFVHHPLPRSISGFINQQISENVPPHEIFQKISKTFTSKDDVNVKNLRMNMIKRIRERARNKSLGPKYESNGLNPDDAKAVYLLVQKMKAGDSLLILEPSEDIDAKEKRFSSMISRMEKNITVINSFLQSAKQMKEDDNTISYVDSMLSDIVSHVKPKPILSDSKISEPILHSNSQEKLITQLSQPPASKRRKMKMKLEIGPSSLVEACLANANGIDQIEYTTELDTKESVA